MESLIKAVKAFRISDNDLVEKPVVWFQAALDFAAWVDCFEETNRKVSQNLSPRALSNNI